MMQLVKLVRRLLASTGRGLLLGLLAACASAPAPLMQEPASEPQLAPAALASPSQSQEKQNLPGPILQCGQKS